MVYTLNHNWEMVIPAYIFIHTPGEIKENCGVAEG